MLGTFGALLVGIFFAVFSFVGLLFVGLLFVGLFVVLFAVSFVDLFLVPFVGLFVVGLIVVSFDYFVLFFVIVPEKSDVIFLNADLKFTIVMTN